MNEKTVNAEKISLYVYLFNTATEDLNALEDVCNRQEEISTSAGECNNETKLYYHRIYMIAWVHECVCVCLYNYMCSSVCVADM